MKTVIVFLLFAALVTLAFRSADSQTAIRGTVSPATSAVKVTAINGMDSVSTVPVSGSFFLGVKPGNWTLKVEAAAPYKNAVKENILVLDHQVTDVGSILLTTG